MILDRRELILLLLLAFLCGSIFSSANLFADTEAGIQYVMSSAYGTDPSGLFKRIQLDRDGFVLANCRPSMEE